MAGSYFLLQLYARGEKKDKSWDWPRVLLLHKRPLLLWLLRHVLGSMNELSQFNWQDSNLTTESQARPSELEKEEKSPAPRWIRTQNHYPLVPLVPPSLRNESNTWKHFFVQPLVGIASLTTKSPALAQWADTWLAISGQSWSSKELDPLRSVQTFGSLGTKRTRWNLVRESWNEQKKF